MIKSYMPKPADIERAWYVVDAEGQTLGRLASRIASLLRGKHKPTFTPSLDCGDFVVVINADKIRVTGRRLDQKKYYHHSGYAGGLSEVTLRKQLETHPTRALEAAVRGMLPKNRLGRQVLKKMKIYAGDKHPHQAQMPVPLEV
ncbi:MAG: 50S ribosomal protein L13 [Candidatus Promineifilaceae bacterium]